MYIIKELPNGKLPIYQNKKYILTFNNLIFKVKKENLENLLNNEDPNGTFEAEHIQITLREYFANETSFNILDFDYSKENLQNMGYQLIKEYKNGDYSFKGQYTEYLVRNGNIIAQGMIVDSFNNGDYSYYKNMTEGYLIRDGNIIAKGASVYSFDNGDYKFKEDNPRYKYIDGEEIELDDEEHLIRNGEEIVVGYKIESYENGDYSFIDENDMFFRYNKNNERID